MTPFTGELSLSRLERVISGPDAIDGLAKELDRPGHRAGGDRDGRTLGASPLLERLTGQLGDRCAAVFVAPVSTCRRRASRTCCA
jgi:hypothetical protein